MHALLAGRYRLIRQVGAGGLATVHLADDVVGGERVAVKLLRDGSDEEAAEHFAREARLGAWLDHPNLVRVHHLLSSAGQDIMVIEFVDGMALSDALSQARARRRAERHRLRAGRERLRDRNLALMREGRGGTREHRRLRRERRRLSEESAAARRAHPLLSARFVVELLRGAAAGLDHAHSRGVVHRDLKPANLLIGRDRVVKVADFGTGFHLNDGERFPPAEETTPFMAPEQLHGGSLDRAVDVHALAAIAHLAMGGRTARAWHATGDEARRAAGDPPADLREAWPDAPATLAMALKAGMAVDPAARPASAGALLQRLHTALAVSS